MVLLACLVFRDSCSLSPFGLQNKTAGHEFWWRLQEVRGSGLLVGIQLSKAAGGIVSAARANGVIVITAGAGDVVRLVPPLNCTDEEIDECVKVLAECISEL